jgi:hypothetical protein
MGIFNSGRVSVKAVLNKDIMYPRDCANITLHVDNSKCKKAVEKYNCKLIRRTEVLNLGKKGKPIYMNDTVI